jgi:hypothetical protein
MGHLPPHCRCPLEEPSLVREHDCLDAVTEVELHQDVRDVGFHGGVTDVELAGNLRVLTGLARSAGTHPARARSAHRAAAAVPGAESA